MATGTTVAGRASGASVDQSVESHLAAPPEVADETSALDLAARRLAELLGPRGIEDLLDFLEGSGDGTYVIMRSSEGGLIGERSIGETSAPRRRTA